MRNKRGFTLVELIVVIAILAIFVTTAMPGFGRLIAREKRVSTVMALTQVLNFARARAITTRNYVAACKSMNGAQCSTGSTTWSDGWIVFINLNRNSRVDAGEPIVRRHGKADDTVEITANRNTFNFRPASIRSTAGSLFVCAANRSRGEAIIVSVTGRVRTSKNKADGSPVVCD